MLKSGIRTINKRALTLVEALFAVALLVVITLLVVSAMNLSQTISLKNRTESDIEGNLKRSLDVLSRDLREALQDNVTITNGSAIAFQIPESTDESGTSYKSVEYSFDSDLKTISRREGGSGNVWQVVGRKITSVNYELSGTTLVNVTLTGENGRVYSTKTFLRNKNS